MAAEATDNAKYLETYGITELINRPPDRGEVLSEADDARTSSRRALLATPQHSDIPSRALREIAISDREADIHSDERQEAEAFARLYISVSRDATQMDRRVQD